MSQPPPSNWNAPGASTDIKIRGDPDLHHSPTDTNIHEQTTPEFTVKANAKALDPAACRRHVEQNFDLDLMARGYERIYRSLISPTTAVAA